MAPETEVVRWRCRKCCFIGLDDEKKLACLGGGCTGAGRDGISEGERGSAVYILLEGRMECCVAGVKVRVLRVHERGFLLKKCAAQVAEISEGRGPRTGHAHERRAVGDGRRPRPASLGFERRHAVVMKEAGRRLAAAALESLYPVARRQQHHA